MRAFWFFLGCLAGATATAVGAALLARRRANTPPAQIPQATVLGVHLAPYTLYAHPEHPTSWFEMERASNGRERVYVWPRAPGGYAWRVLYSDSPADWTRLVKALNREARPSGWPHAGR